MYEFVTIGGGEYFVDIFNGLAMIVKSGDYMNIVKISAVLAFFMAVINAAFMGSLHDSAKWFVTTLLITQIMLYPKASIHVTDKTNPSLNGSKVDNVPFVIAYTASTTSQIGYSLTKMFESAYSLPDDLQYSENGMIFGANLMEAMTAARITNQTLAANIDSFSRECIFYDIHLGIYSFEDLSVSEDIWSFVKSKQVENRFFTYRNQETKAVTYPTCKDGSQALDSDWNKEFQLNLKGGPTAWMSLGFMAKRPKLSKAILSAAAPLATNYFMNVSQSAETTLRQAMMLNALDTAVENQEAQSQVYNYQNARAQALARSTYQTMGAQAGMWIPMLKIVIEVLFYGAFPIVILVSLIPNLAASVLRGYFTTFFWLASWGPLYAIFHRISMGLGKIYTLSLSDNIGMTMMNQFGLQQTMNDIAAMAGYMSMCTPMFAYVIAKGGPAAMSSMATSFMSGIQGAVSTATHEGTTGNLAFGNVGLNSRMASSGITMVNEAGQAIHHHSDGTSSIDNSKVESRLGTELHGSERITSENSRMSSQEQSIGESKSIQAQTSSAQGFEKMLNDHRSIENSKGFEQNFSSEQKESFSKINTAATDFAVNHNINREKSAEIFASIGAGKSFGVSGKILASDTQLYSEAQKYAKEHHLSKDFQVVSSAMQSNRFNLTDSKGESINESFNKSASLNKEASQHFESSKRYSEQAQYAKSHSVEIDKNLNQEFFGELVNKHGIVEAARITNPSNSDKTLLNEKINEFMSSKTQEEINQIQKPDFEREYNILSTKFATNNQPVKHMQNEHSFTFNVPREAINNSNLQQSTANKFNDTQAIINDAKVSNLGAGREVVGKVREEGNEGVVFGVIDEAVTNGEKVFGEASNLLREDKK